MRRSLVHVDDRGDDVALAVTLRKEVGAVHKELPLLAWRKPAKEFPVRAHDEGTHQNGIFPHFGRQVKGFDLIVDELRVAALPFDDVVVASRARGVYLRVTRPIGFIPLVLLFDGRNVRLVILFHVTN